MRFTGTSHRHQATMPNKLTAVHTSSQRAAYRETWRGIRRWRFTVGLFVFAPPKRKILGGRGRRGVKSNYCQITVYSITTVCLDSTEALFKL